MHADSCPTHVYIFLDAAYKFPSIVHDFDLFEQTIEVHMMHIFVELLHIWGLLAASIRLGLDLELLVAVPLPPDEPYSNRISCHSYLRLHTAVLLPWIYPIHP